MASPDYVAKGCGMGREATLYLLERGVRADRHRRLELGRALHPHREEIRARPTIAELIWEGHRAGREIGYCHIEKLHNLEALPADGFMVSCFPVKIRGALGRLDARGGDLRWLIARSKI